MGIPRLRRIFKAAPRQDGIYMLDLQEYDFNALADLLDRLAAVEVHRITKKKLLEILPPA